MEEKFKMTKFQGDGAGFVQIRYQALLNGKVIAFAIAGTELSTLQFGDPIDFDKESDALLEKHHDSERNMAFEYVPNIGFDEVDTASQSWFKF
jgi:hypothetical protein